MPVLFERAAVIGVGLIGGSLSAAARRAGCVGRVVGVGRGEANLAVARQRNLVDETSHDLAVVRDADLVVLAVPVGSIVPVARALVPHLRDGTVVTDVGSVKDSVVGALETALPGACHFVGGHPIAGTEQAGAAAADAELFRGSICVLTPGERTDEAATARVEKLWKAVGARVVRMDARRHDRALAWTSHLCHALAYTLTRAVNEADPQFLALVGPSFRDATRVASTAPELWRDIMLVNAKALSEVIETFSTELERLRRAIEAGEDGTVADLLRAGRAARVKVEETAR